MAEDDGLSFAPVFVIDVDVSSVFFSYSYVWHCVFPFLFIARTIALWLEVNFCKVASYNFVTLPRGLI